MKQSTPERVTSLTFTHYDPANYALNQDEGMKLSSINKIILNLFNNDLYVFTLLVGRMKGLWWKYWFSDSSIKGYSLGDMICSNGVQEIDFLKKYWESVKTIADYGTVSNKLPWFSSTDEETVSKYMNALGDYFHLGGRALERQIYISLRDNNKDAVAITDSWQPYIVTAEELHRREYHITNILEDQIKDHNTRYHSDLDVLDSADFEYEVNNNPSSLYDSALVSYLPKIGISGKENEHWVDFASGRDSAASSLSDKILGLGTIVYDFIHIVKPLGTDVHHLETWVRTDGHVTIKGYVPVAMLTELIPDEGTLEYSKWKMGGSRRYGMRLDYPINDTISKLYFKEGDDVSTTVSSDVSDVMISGQPAQREVKRMIEETDVTESLYNILSYNPPYTGTVLFRPNSPDCDFPFEDLPKHTGLLKDGDDVILQDLLDPNKYIHTFEPNEQPNSNGSPFKDETVVEVHLFNKKSNLNDTPVDPVPSPVDRAADGDNVSGDLRLLRNFGTTRSPALKNILQASVFPDVNELVMPSSMVPTVSINEWSWISGQSIVFEVPGETQNIQFEVNGILKENNFDFSLYDIFNQGTDHIQWVHDLVMNYDFPKAVIAASEAEGVESDDSFPLLVKNMSGMMNKMEHCVLEYPTFLTFMLFRSLDSSPLTSVNGLLTLLKEHADSCCDDSNPNGIPKFKESCRLLKTLYEYLYVYIAEDFRYGALHDCFAELVSLSASLDHDKLVLADKLKSFLNSKALGNNWIAMVGDAMNTANNGMVELVNEKHAELANQFKLVIKKLQAMYDKYNSERELENNSSLTDLPNYPTQDEHSTALKKYQDRYLENFDEINEYLDEVDNNLTSCDKLNQKIADYLKFDWLDDSTRSYLIYQRKKLNDTILRYKKINFNICLGYDKYVEKWSAIFEITRDKYSVLLSKLQTTKNNLKGDA